MVLDEVQSLEECCLSTIVANFDLFMMDYRSSEPRFSKPYEFLQRTYSDMLMAKLIEKCKLQDEHLYFLINPYIKKLHFEKSTVNPQIVIERLKVVGSAITTLDLSPIECTSNEIKELLHLMPMLRTLTLHDKERETILRLRAPILRSGNRNLFNDVLKQVAKNCPHLEVLEVGNSTVTIEGLKHFCKDDNDCTIDNMTLKELKISKTRILPQDLAFILEHCPSLTTLEHKAVCEAICYRHLTGFQNNVIETLPQYNLTALSLSRTICYHNTKDVLNLCAVVCPNINALRILYLRSEEDVTACMRFKNLTQLMVFVDESARVSLTPFIESTGVNLQRYEQINGDISALKLCECCPKLRHLKLSSVKFEIFAMSKKYSTVYSSPNLVDLHVSIDPFIQPCVAESINRLVSSSSILKSLNCDYAKRLTEKIINSFSCCHCFRKALCTFDIKCSEFNVHLARIALGCAHKVGSFVIYNATITSEQYVDVSSHVSVNCIAEMISRTSGW